MQAPEIIVMVKSEVGLSRVTMRSNQTFQDFLKKVSEVTNRPIEALIPTIEGFQMLKCPPLTLLFKVPNFINGAEVKVAFNPKVKVQKMQMEVEPQQVKKVIYTASGKIADQKQLNKAAEHEITHVNKEHVLSQFCQHGPQAKCLNCMSASETKEDKTKQEIRKCNHGEGGRCLNCAPFEQEKKGTIKKADKLMCMHGPNGKCAHCIDENQIEAKHISFDQYLLDQKFKCRGQHPEDGKCNNCLPPSAISYKLKKDCKNHAPYPKAMCNNCMPPSILLKRQNYRHVDYVEFLNIPEMSNLVQYWSSKGKSEQRIGFLYGYYAADPNYKNGVRAIVEAIYEPPQKGFVGNVELQKDPFQIQVDQIATALGLEKIGWIFTTINHDCFLSSEELRQAAKYQYEHQVKHPSGNLVSKFLTVVLRTKKDNRDEVLPEVYMISDQGQQLEYDQTFVNSDRRKVLKVRSPVNEEDVLPTFIYEGKSVSEFEPDFFIVNVAHGYNPNSNYNIMKLYDFPVENRLPFAQAGDVKTFLHKHQKKAAKVRFADFHLLLFLCKLIDFDTVAHIADHVGQEVDITNDLLEVVKLYTQNQ